MFVILRKGREDNLTPDLMISLFHKIVVPVISYGSEVWGYENLDSGINLFLGLGQPVAHGFHDLFGPFQSLQVGRSVIELHSLLLHRDAVWDGVVD